MGLLGVWGFHRVIPSSGVLCLHIPHKVKPRVHNRNIAVEDSPMIILSRQARFELTFAFDEVWSPFRTNRLLAAVSKELVDNLCYKTQCRSKSLRI